MKTNRFLSEKVKEKGLTAKDFAQMVKISEVYARKLLSPSSKKLPSDEVGRRIVSALELKGDEEKEFWRLLSEDRAELDGGPVPNPEPVPLPCPELPEFSELWKEVRRIDGRLDESEDWVHEVEEGLWKYKEEDRLWRGKVEEKLREIELGVREIREVQEISFKRAWKWLWVIGIGLGTLFLLCAGVLILFGVMGMLS